MINGPMPPSGRMPMNNTEMRFTEKIVAMAFLFEKHAKDLEKRARMIDKTTWRDVRCVSAMLLRLSEKFMWTMPQGQIKTLRALVHNGVMMVNLRGAAKIDGFVVMPVEDARVIVGAVMENQCAICMKTPGEIKACRLRKAMETSMPPAEYPDGGCGYQEMEAIQQ